MNRFALLLIVLLSLGLTACGSSTEDSSESGLLNFFNSEAMPANEVQPDPDEVPYSEGPSAIPLELVPNS